MVGTSPPVARSAVYSQVLLRASYVQVGAAVGLLWVCNGMCAVENGKCK